MPYKDKEEYKKYQAGYQEKNRVKIRKQNIEWQKSNPEKLWASSIKYRYGITTDQFFELLKEQGGSCAICKKASGRRLDIDHNHTTGRVRGLLCNSCNRAIGHFKESIENMKQAITYLEKHSVGV